MSEEVFEASPSITKRKWRRVHGLQWPWHPQQVVAWLILIYFTLFTFCVVIPSFNRNAAIVLTAIHAILFLIHFISHTVAELLDPADPELRALDSKKPVPEFDRNKHAHVIENGRCHLCNITISSQRTKHCSACNKCVHVFDHHCKWLNQCIGDRNYRWFATSVATAIAMSLSYIVITLTTVGLYYGDNLTYLKPWEDTNTTLAMINNAANMSSGTENIIGEQFELFFLPVPTAAFMFMAISSIVLAFIAFALLLHLAIFHLYINHVGITTYEYVRAHRLALEPQTMQLSDPANNQLATVKENQEDQTTDSNCCQIFTRKAKVAPAPAEPTSTTATEHKGHNGTNGDTHRRITDEKLPPIHPSPHRIKKVEEKPEFEKSNKPKGSSVVRLPKLVEENGSATTSAASNGNLNSASTTSKRPQLAKVHKHLESVDFEDQEKIYVVEVS